MDRRRGFPTAYFYALNWLSAITQLKEPEKREGISLMVEFNPASKCWFWKGLSAMHYKCRVDYVHSWPLQAFERKQG